MKLKQILKILGSSYILATLAYAANLGIFDLGDVSAKSIKALYKERIHLILKIGKAKPASVRVPESTREPMPQGFPRPLTLEPEPSSHGIEGTPVPEAAEDNYLAFLSHPDLG